MKKLILMFLASLALSAQAQYTAQELATYGAPYNALSEQSVRSGIAWELAQLASVSFEDVVAGSTEYDSLSDRQLMNSMAYLLGVIASVGGSATNLTPWPSDINANGKSLTNAATVKATTLEGALAATQLTGDVALARLTSLTGGGTNLEQGWALLSTNVLASAGGGLTNIISARQAGAVSDVVITKDFSDPSDVVTFSMTGTDNTTIIQNILNRATNSGVTGIELLIDGKFGVSDLVVYSNTTIRCVGDSGLYQVVHHAMPLIRNANPTTNAIIDKNITLVGGTFYADLWTAQLNGVVGTSIATSNANNGDWFIHGLGFYGVQNLTIRDCTISGGPTYGVAISNWRDVLIENVNIEHNGADGLHFFSGTNLVVRNVRGATFDDLIALNGTDYLTVLPVDWVIPVGPIYNVLIDGVERVKDAWTGNGVSILCSDSDMQNITVRNVLGDAGVFAVRVWNVWTTPNGAVGGGIVRGLVVDGAANVIFNAVSGTDLHIADARISNVPNCGYADSPLDAIALSAQSSTLSIGSLLISQSLMDEPTDNTASRACVSLNGSGGATIIVTNLSLSGLIWNKPSGATTTNFVINSTSGSSISNLVLQNIIGNHLLGLTNPTGIVGTLNTNSIIWK